MSSWWEDLTPDQNERLGALIDSRVRLLGETYSRAHDRCTVNVSDENRIYILGPSNQREPMPAETPTTHGQVPPTLHKTSIPCQHLDTVLKLGAPTHMITKCPELATHILVTKDWDEWESATRLGIDVDASPPLIIRLLCSDHFYANGSRFVNTSAPDDFLMTAELKPNTVRVRGDIYDKEK